MADIELLQRVQDALVEHEGNKAAVMRELGISSRGHFYDLLAKCKELGITPNVVPPSTKAALTKVKYEYEDQIRDLQGQLREAVRDNLTAEKVREYYFGLTNDLPEPPKWVVKSNKPKSAPGVPILQWSDFHWGEVVTLDATGGKNEYNTKIARERLERLTERSLDLMMNHMVNPDYPGAVIVLGGDMVSGDIHEELARTNDGFTMEHVFDIFTHLAAAINAVADKVGQVLVVTAYGNHGRNTRRPIMKGSAYTNFDWMIYTMLEHHFKAKGDDRVVFIVPSEPDALVQVYDSKYLITHGDRLGARGGDGVIGMLSPIARGIKKTREQYARAGEHVDWVVIGHFHNRMWLDQFGGIVNSSLKGWDEYAKDELRAPYTPPSQNIWWHHPVHGPTFNTQVFVEDKPEAKEFYDWVSFRDKVKG